MNDIGEVVGRLGDPPLVAFVRNAGEMTNLAGTVRTWLVRSALSLLSVDGPRQICNQLFHLEGRVST